MKRDSWIELFKELKYVTYVYLCNELITFTKWFLDAKRVVIHYKK